MLSVIHKGKEYILLQDLTVNTSLDNLCGSFGFKTTLNKKIPFGQRSFISMKADNKIVCSGYIEKLNGNITDSAQEISYSGRDLLGDLVDSSVLGSASMVEGAITLPDLCKRYIDSLGIKADVINLAGDIKAFDKNDITAVEFGAKAGETLQAFARKRQLFLTTFGDGNLVIFKPPTSPSYKKLVVDSLMERSFSFDDTNRFYKIDIGSEDNASAQDVGIAETIANLANSISGDSTESNPVSRISTVIDEDIRKTRYLQVQAEESMNDAELQKKAFEESDVRRMRGFNYKVKVPSHEYRIGKIIPIEDDLAGVSGNFLIKDCSYTTGNSGNYSQLTVCYPESYQAVEERISRQRSKIGDAKDVELVKLNEILPDLKFDIEDFSRDIQKKVLS
jgi:prophage tail gpP-like protein